MTENQDNKISDRIKHVRKLLKLNQKTFAAQMGYGQSIISEIEKGTKSPTERFLISLSDKYNIRKQWIITGEEPIFHPEKENNGKPISDIFRVDEEISHNKYIEIGDGTMLMLTPLVEEYAYAGYLAGYRDREYIEELPTHPIFVNKYHKGNYQSFQAVGDSMTSLDPNLVEYNIYHGNIVTGREIIRVHWQSRLHTHAFLDYVIVHKDGILIKRVTHHDVEKGILTLHSLNENKQMYPDFHVKLDDVYQIFSIVEVSQKRKR